MSCGINMWLSDLAPLTCMRNINIVDGTSNGPHIQPPAAEVNITMTIMIIISGGIYITRNPDIPFSDLPGPSYQNTDSSIVLFTDTIFTDNYRIRIRIWRA